jgi:hypothetical protein
MFGPTFTLNEYWLIGGIWTIRANGLGLPIPFKYTTGGTQITESDRNRWPLPKGKDLGDYGSEFYTLKQEVVTSKFPHSTLFSKPNPLLGGHVSKADGSLIANCFNVHNTGFLKGLLDVPIKYAFPPDLSSSRSALVVKGTIAVASSSPGNQIANAASAVGELLQDVPNIPGVHLWESRLKAIEAIARSGADEFLNVVFGILPTIGDMDDFLKAVHKIDRVVDQFIRDSGRSVRREFHFDKEMTTTTEVIPDRYSPAGAEVRISNGSSHNSLINDGGNGLPAYQTIRTRTVERDIWFSGAFTYHLPDWFSSDSTSDRRKLMAQLFGGKPDLNTLWQLAPWSWAIDWFTNASSFVKNCQSLINYGTILRYGYIMETTTITDTYTAGIEASLSHASSGWVYNQPYPVVSPVTLRTTVKKRIQANPFGFGLSWDGLTSVQQAILAALAITRVVR